MQHSNNDYSRTSYSLEGEDLILWRFFDDKKSGFYVDVGAYHPFRYSNTYLFYRHGWHGINIDATPGSMDLFREHRAKDINVETAVSSRPGLKKFYIFDETALNSFDETLSKDRAGRGHSIINIIDVATHTLAEILREHVPSNTAIDFLNIDVEGSELDVLQSNDWASFKPRYILVEISGFDKKNGLTASEIMTSDVGIFLKGEGYLCVAKTFDTAVFVLERDTGQDDFLDGGLWTPQTSMMRAIQSWVIDSDFHIQHALSIDNNPTIDPIIKRKWPQAKIERAVFPIHEAMDLADLPNDTYDLVYSHQVLEHIPKPWNAAKEMVRILRPGGIGIHTSCAFNPRHGQPHFGDYYRFLPEGLAELFDGVEVLEKGEWGNREAILHNVGINDGYGDLGGRRFSQVLGSKNDGLYPWVTWIIFCKQPSMNSIGLNKSNSLGESESHLRPSSIIASSSGTVQTDSHDIQFILKPKEVPYFDRLLDRSCDEEVFAVFRQCLHPGDVVFDVGAHIGRYSVYSSRIIGPSGKVYAFEPVHDTYWMLRATLSLNHSQNVIPINRALSDRVGLSKIHVFPDPFSSWSSLGCHKMQAPEGTSIETDKVEQVQSTTIDVFCQTENIDRIHFLKIDVEGYECAVLAGATSFMHDRKIDLICFEISKIPLESSGFSSTQIMDLLKENQYAVYRYIIEEKTFEEVRDDCSCFHGNFYASYNALDQLPINR
jgi:FkbM family methyltransferase